MYNQEYKDKFSILSDDHLKKMCYDSLYAHRESSTNNRLLKPFLTYQEFKGVNAERYFTSSPNYNRLASDLIKRNYLIA